MDCWELSKILSFCEEKREISKFHKMKFTGQIQYLWQKTNVQFVDEGVLLAMSAFSVTPMFIHDVWQLFTIGCDKKTKQTVLKTNKNDDNDNDDNNAVLQSTHSSSLSKCF
jgi:hypothetical protein